MAKRKSPKGVGHHHPSHPETEIRLKRASGHLSKVIDMVHDGRGCTDILQQLSAVISALESCRISLLQDHIDSCISPIVPENSKHVVKELELVIKRVLK